VDLRVRPQKGLKIRGKSKKQGRAIQTDSGRLQREPLWDKIPMSRKKSKIGGGEK